MWGLGQVITSSLSEWINAIQGFDLDCKLLVHILVLWARTWRLRDALRPS